MKKSLKKFNKNYWLHNLKDKQVNENNLSEYLKDVLVLKNKSL